MSTNVNHKPHAGLLNVLELFSLLFRLLPPRNKIQCFRQRIHPRFSSLLFIFPSVAFKKLCPPQVHRDKQMSAIIITQMPSEIWKTAILQSLYNLFCCELRWPHSIHFRGNQQNRAGYFLGLNHGGRVRMLHKRQVKIIHS